MARNRLKLGEILVQEGALSEQQVEQGLNIAKGQGKRLGETLVELGFINEDQCVKALAQRLVSTESRLEATEAGYEVGTRTIVDVLDAQGDRLESRRDLSRERYDYILNTLRLKLAAGILASEDVYEVDSWLR